MKTYLVGGAVRDSLLGIAVTDHDYVVVGGSQRQMLALGYTPVGKDFPVFLHPETKAEYALARQERKVGAGYTGFTFDTDASVTLEDDLLRRDLTINAMAQDQDGTIVDPYGGQADLSAKVLRHVSPAFSEDPLRILRVARFYARFAHLGFTIAPETTSLMRDMVEQGALDELSAPRVWQEMLKVLLEPNPSAFFVELAEIDGLAPWFAEFTTVDVQNKAWQAQLIQSQANSMAVRTAVCLSILPAEKQQAFCQRMPIPSDVKDIVTLITDIETRLVNYQALSAQEIVEVLYRVDVLRRPERLARLLRVMTITHPELDNIIEFFDAMEQAFRSVKASDLIAQGIIGSAIKDALRTAQIEKIQSFLTR